MSEHLSHPKKRWRILTLLDAPHFNVLGAAKKVTAVVIVCAAVDTVSSIVSWFFSFFGEYTHLRNQFVGIQPKSKC